MISCVAGCDRVASGRAKAARVGTNRTLWAPHNRLPRLRSRASNLIFQLAALDLLIDCLPSMACSIDTSHPRQPSNRRVDQLAERPLSDRERRRISEESRGASRIAEDLISLFQHSVRNDRRSMQCSQHQNLPLQSRDCRMCLLGPAISHRRRRINLPSWRELSEVLGNSDLTEIVCQLLQGSKHAFPCSRSSVAGDNKSGLKRGKL